MPGTNLNNLDAYNEVEAALGGTGTQLNDIVTVRAIAVLEGASGGPASILDDNMVLRLNAIDVDAGGPGGHLNTLDALNSIVVLKGGLGGHLNDLDAINEWVDFVGAFDPTDVTSASIHRWLRKSQGLFQEENNGLGSTPSGVGDVVGRWEDHLLGHASRLSQATTSLKPIAQADGSLLFDGVDDLLLGDWSGLSSEGHLFIRVKINTDPPVGDAQTGFYFLNAGNMDNTHHPFTDNLVYDAALTTVRKDGIATPDAFTVFHTWSISSKAGEWVARFNSTIYHSTGTNTFSSPGATAQLGKSRGPAVFHLDGFILEAILFDATLSAADLANMIAYMGAL